MITMFDRVKHTQQSTLNLFLLLQSFVSCNCPCCFPERLCMCFLNTVLMRGVAYRRCHLHPCSCAHTDALTGDFERNSRKNKEVLYCLLPANPQWAEVSRIQTFQISSPRPHGQCPPGEPSRTPLRDLFKKFCSLHMPLMFWFVVAKTNWLYRCMCKYYVFII